MNNRAFVILCAVLLFLPGLASLVGNFRSEDEDAAKAEARSLAVAPEAEWMWTGRWTDFTQQSELFLNDHFGLRAPLLAMNAQMRRVLASPGSAEVVVGRRGWLFYADGLVNQSPSGDEAAIPRLVAQADMLQALYERLHRDGADFAVLIAPDKHSIYPEMLPGWLADRPQGRQYGWLVAELRKRGVPVVDVREPLHRIKTKGPVYYRTDTHWTMYGALLAFNQVMKTMGRPRLAGISSLKFKETTGTDTDLSRMALMGKKHREYVVSAYRPELKDDFTVTPLHIPNDPSRQAHRVERRGRGPSMVVLGDSFTRYTFRRPAMHMSKRLTWLHHQNCDFDWATVRQAKPDVVIYEIVERNLGCSPESARKKVQRIRADKPA